ncbi:hypothetical protein AV530_004354 [Patagioenas fasciata monilis]|uniref:Uncharacterized protein n=1 Tax=Patagioenas fasciata monilis TaxID=372326 RepID=A0A1V4K957_PATFA|nr:hypothetical protein AV530_004354 [Patagioenas fasciata monilis]
MKSLRKTLTNNLECLTNYAQLLLNEECKYRAKQRQEISFDWEVFLQGLMEKLVGCFILLFPRGEFS